MGLSQFGLVGVEWWSEVEWAAEVHGWSGVEGRGEERRGEERVVVGIRDGGGLGRKIPYSYGWVSTQTCLIGERNLTTISFFVVKVYSRQRPR
ncbi:Protein of unknown function [Gryllus bimaculatus]|nr:Protein of unknown function [Gryllus bimaculatus]